MSTIQTFQGAKLVERVERDENGRKRIVREVTPAPDKPVLLHEAELPIEAQRARIKGLLEGSDADMARVVEDIFDALPDDVKAKLPSRAVEKIAARKALRAAFANLNTRG